MGAGASSAKSFHKMASGGFHPDNLQEGEYCNFLHGGTQPILKTHKSEKIIKERTSREVLYVLYKALRTLHD